MNFHKLRVTTGISIKHSKYFSGIAKAELPASFVKDDVEYVPERDKSGLRPQHKNVLLETMPYNEAHSWIHLTEKYQRSLYGRYGSKSKVNPQICFGTLAERTKAQERQAITQPETLPEILEKLRITKAAKQAAIKDREDAILKKLEKLEQWKADLNAKVAKRKADAAAAIQRKERLIEEVRRHFGFKVDTRDERFKEMLEQKEKEDKRKQKEAKRKVKEEKMMAKLVQQTN
ncbi:growth arrest and DNA damage-inducible proteins-interacting protein 1 [Drosophila novamexicana]|uniref:growth arrest and DNA damage-inducible proteins-interacting protein 1 n=1 Tax=Drosophila novamexicana TaxID=47314 RepID=UPI0011E5C38B|nr:growth arrest and DNA damage-inducible proteins-interacting protein 1 [Drosophila novamexicana]